MQAIFDAQTRSFTAHSSWPWAWGLTLILEIEKMVMWRFGWIEELA